MRQTTSPSETEDPTGATHSTMVPSVMESPIVGTLIVSFSGLVGVVKKDLAVGVEDNEVDVMS